MTKFWTDFSLLLLHLDISLLECNVFVFSAEVVDVCGYSAGGVNFR